MEDLFEKMREFVQRIKHAVFKRSPDKDLSEEKNEFVAIASHQLRTPISALRGYLSMLREGSYGKLSPDQLEVIDKSFRITSIMERMVSNFLNLSHAEIGTLKFYFEKKDLRDIINEVVEGHKPQAGRKGLSLNWEKPKEPMYIDADMEKLPQAFSNIIDNAIRYTPKGGVSLRTYEDKYSNMVKVFIKDTGIGMNAGEEKEIFKSFHRGKGGAEIHSSGAGLGLYVAKMIVEGHGGNVQAESEGKNRGSTFIVKLPLG